MKKSPEAMINFHVHEDSTAPEQSKQINLVAALVFKYIQSTKDESKHAEIA